MTWAIISIAGCDKECNCDCLSQKQMSVMVYSWKWAVSYFFDAPCTSLHSLEVVTLMHRRNPTKSCMPILITRLAGILDSDWSVMVFCTAKLYNWPLIQGTDLMFFYSFKKNSFESSQYFMQLYNSQNNVQLGICSDSKPCELPKTAWKLITLRYLVLRYLYFKATLHA